jgi:hypothetical protein
MRFILIFLFCVQSGLCFADGAIAITQDSDKPILAFISGNRETQAEATDSALSICKDRTNGKCKILSVFRDSCAAVAISKSPPYAAMSTAADGDGAKAGALLLCSQQSGSTCTIERWTCDSAWGIKKSELNRAIIRSESRADIFLTMVAIILLLLLVCGFLSYRLYATKPTVPLDAHSRLPPQDDIKEQVTASSRWTSSTPKPEPTPESKIIKSETFDL